MVGYEQLVVRVTQEIIFGPSTGRSKIACTQMHTCHT